ncbi:MAG: hypothetical protein KDB22_08155 [Planctomycetales bacterium]|nr:hypothetical protein [Planctomycetales bacterium]
MAKQSSCTHLRWDAFTGYLILGFFVLETLCSSGTKPLLAQSLQGIELEIQLRKTSFNQLQQRAEQNGNSARGAILFHGPLLGCSKCHSVSDSGRNLLGPNLAQPLKNGTPAHIVESVLDPSKVIDTAYQGAQLLTSDGNVVTGLKIAEDSQKVVLREPATLRDVEYALADVEQIQTLETSLMPTGLVRALANASEFDDLLKYVLEIQRGGPQRARELQPSAAQLAIRLPEYEANIDHKTLIQQWDDRSLARGEAIYQGLCVNCHGTLTLPGSLASAARFGQQQFKYGNDPYSMYQTLTRGAGLMLPQPWMVPQQKYDVIHYIREHFLRGHNSAQLSTVDDQYLAGLPTGNELGPEPQPVEPWSQADYGPRLVGTYEIGSGGRNIAQKGIAIQLDDSPGGVAQGDAWAVFDHDTMRLAGVWTSRGFIDWQGINFNGRHGIHPHIVGDILLSNPTGPGWASPATGSLADDLRVVGRDDKRYGPLPKDWIRYRGFYQAGRRTIVAYQVGETEVHESFQWLRPSVQLGEAQASAIQEGFFARHVDLGPRPQTLKMVVATLDDGRRWNIADNLAIAMDQTDVASARSTGRFSGTSYYETASWDEVNLYDQDFTLRANVIIGGDGTLFSSVPANGNWQKDGQAWFVRNGRLAYDIGWVGVIESAQRIDDGKPHSVALTFRAKGGVAELWVDGVRSRKKKLQPKERLGEARIRVGYTTAQFPAQSKLKDSSIERLQLFSRVLATEEIVDWQLSSDAVADWSFASQPTVSGVQSDEVPNASPQGHSLALKQFDQQPLAPALFGVASSQPGCTLECHDQQLLLSIAPGTQSMQLTLWAVAPSRDAAQQDVRDQVVLALDDSRDNAVSLAPKEPLFPELVQTPLVVGEPHQGFSVDTLTVPKNNPWNARLRLTGIDFFKNPDRLAVCTWDGDVWLVSGLAHTGTEQQLTWRRIAFGLFQPLGLKIIDETIYLTCRDQLVRLDDRNGDGEIDYYHCVNNDHQVTEHFHEFAMGLQTDESGNFYYAKSARHALPAVVPHHGTLLRVTPDGERTDILAQGFRAANGVCLNPDGTFIVTDQEGHWNPKNRINWVSEGGFYGNMYGYHDVTDESDDAMQQPLCWITNAFDRSPAELLWCNSRQWGPFRGSLLNLSYGYGKVFVVPHETVAGQVQGGMCALPIPDFPTGIIRGRFSPHDGQLYLCGLSAWASSQTAEEGGLYRVRYAGQYAALPIALNAAEQQLTIGFSEPLHETTSLDPANYSVRVWDLKRTKNYGSEHYNERRIDIRRVELSSDRLQLRLIMSELNPTWSMEISLPVVSGDGQPAERVIHNTIHHVVESKTNP